MQVSAVANDVLGDLSALEIARLIANGEFTATDSVQADRHWHACRRSTGWNCFGSAADRKRRAEHAKRCEDEDGYLER